MLRARGDRESSASRHPFVWIVWLTTVLVVAVFSAKAWELLPNGRTIKVFGWSEAARAAGWYVVDVSNGGPASGLLQRGDRLISLNGDRNVARAGTGFYRSELAAAESYQVEVERAGQLVVHELRVAEQRRTLTVDLPFLLEGLLWCIPALFIGFARPDQGLARLAFAGATLAGLLIAGRSAAAGNWLASLNGLHVVIGYHFFYRFPAGPPPERSWRLLLWALYAGAAATTALRQWLSTISLAQGAAVATRLLADHATLFHARILLSQAVLLVSVMATIAVIARNYRRLTDTDHRQRIRWVAFSSVAGLLPRLALGVASLVPSMGGNTPDFAFQLFGVGSTTAIPLGVSYAILKHRVLDIRVVVRRGMQYLFARRALQLLLAAPVFALSAIVVTQRNLTIVQLATHHLGYLYWIGAAALSLKFREPMGLWLDRRFFREHYDRERVLAGLLNDLSKLDSADDMSHVVTAQLEYALHPKTIYLWYCRGQEATLAYQADPSGDRANFPPGRLLGFLVGQDQILDVPLPDSAGISVEEETWLESLGVRLIVPITSDRTLGLLMLGERKSEELYSGDDRRVLQSIAKQIAVVRENLSLKARVGEEERIRYNVLARVDPQVLNLLRECPSCGACYDSAETRCARDGQSLSVSLPVDRTIDGKYRLEQLLGRGGMGSVYQASDLRLERTVAVKLMTGPAFGDDRAARRFHREARTAARLTHKNVVTVYDYGTIGHEIAYLVMERVPGTTLRAHLGAVGVLSHAEAADLFDLLLDGLSAAHAEGIVHRDLKPENVVGLWSLRPLELKILDFGLAKFRPLENATVGTSITVPGMALGTVGYMSPEQLVGAETDERADIFALGVMLVESLTGSRPFRGDSYGALLHSILLETCHLPVVSPEARALDDLVQRCLAKDPKDRISSAAALRRELIPALRAHGPRVEDSRSC